MVFDDAGLYETWEEAHIYYSECNPEEQERMELCNAIIDATARLYALDYNKQIQKHRQVTP